MQQAQDLLGFPIETPSDEELAKRFAKQQADLTESFGMPKQTKAKNHKRTKKSAKKLARTNKQFLKAKYKRSNATV